MTVQFSPAFLLAATHLNPLPTDFFFVSSLITKEEKSEARQPGGFVRSFLVKFSAASPSQ